MTNLGNCFEDDLRICQITQLKIILINFRYDLRQIFMVSQCGINYQVLAGLGENWIVTLGTTIAKLETYQFNA